MSSPNSLIYNAKNETPQLNPNSELVSDHTPSQWWKYLESPNSKSNTSTRSRPKSISAVMTRTNVLETSTSESEREHILKKKKVQLKVSRRKSNSNAFLDVFNNAKVSVPLKLRMKQRKYSNLPNNSDKEVSEKKLEEINHDSSSSLSPSIVKLKSSIFKRKSGEETKSHNLFQDIVRENDNSDVRKKSVTLEKKSNHSIYQSVNTNKDHIDQNINTSKDHIDRIKTIQMSKTLSFENNEAGPSNSSISTAMLENNVISDINKTVETSNDSNIEVSNRKRFKFKSHLMERNNTDTNPFKSALAENRDTSLLEHNQNKEIDVHDAKSLRTKSLSPSKKSANRLKKKTDVTLENVLSSSPIRRNMSAQVQDNNEQNTSNSSLDNDEFRTKKPAYLKLKSKISPLRKKSLNNPFKDILMEDGSINARKSNIAMSAEDHHISVEQDKITTENSKGHEQVVMERYSQSMSHINEDFETSLKISSSNNVRNVSEKLNVQPKKKNKFSESNVNVSKSSSQRSVISEDKSEASPNKKQISFSRNSIRNKSEISKEHANVMSTDRTNINEMETRKARSDKLLRQDKFFTAQGASTSHVRNLLTSQVVNVEAFEKIKAEVDKLKTHELARIRIADEKKESASKATNVKLLSNMRKQPTKKNKSPKFVDKAYLVNGKVYKPPRLPRPKHWVTDHFYKFLWKRMEPKYQLSTRMRSEKFVLLLAKIVSIIERRKKYQNYKLELEALMKEMARLNIIGTRNDFYHFCQDFMPYEFRVKVIPMLMPGNKQNIPFEPEKLHTPLLEET
ncbi:uncharacterized protein LOC105247998 [Camponotus floridanus]|uniref:uncharacterized protein LOC105247998 n=1 Tax=Camponotus floridanus TaxID=104421 RepID=UPI000DC6B0DF|nr:uncharacterized protein LOC105247998 [Camponotus floridanus]